jgi:Fanconi anemia group M protein
MQPRIIADTREVSSGIPDVLRQRADVSIQQLPVGDYIVSGRIAVERKRAEDFLDSLVRKRLFGQIIRLKEAYEKPVLIIEDEGLFDRSVDSRAVYGAIACFLADYDLPVMRTKDRLETAAMVISLARREQLKNRREVCLRGHKPRMELHDWQRFVVEGLPSISAVLARRLLAHFGSARRVLSATAEELQEVEGIGRIKAERVCQVLDAAWEEED